MPHVPTHPDAQLVLTDHGLVLLAEAHPDGATLTLTLIDAGRHEEITGACPLCRAPHLARAIEDGEGASVHDLAPGLDRVTFIRAAGQTLTLGTVLPLGMPPQDAQFLLSGQDRRRVAQAIRDALPQGPLAS